MGVGSLPPHIDLSQAGCLGSAFTLPSVWPLGPALTPALGSLLSLPICLPETRVSTTLQQACKAPEGMPRHGGAGSPEILQSSEPTGGTWKVVGGVEARSWGFFLNNNLVPQLIGGSACLQAGLHHPHPGGAFIFKAFGKQLINPHSPTACPEGC